jgi:hypothetical protein
MSEPAVRLTREGVCRTFGLSHEVLDALEGRGVLAPDADHMFDLAGTAMAVFRFGLEQAAEAEQKLAAVASAIRDVLPALQQLSELPQRAALEGEARDRATVELSTFFTAFARLIARGSAALDGPSGEGAGE